MRQMIVFSIFAAMVGAAEARADADALLGEKIFKRCMACHAVDDGSNKVGPTLKAVVGRVVGSVEGYAYSDDLLAMKAEAKTWDDALLDAYLTNPKAIAPAGKMAFGGLRKAEDRANLIAFLKSKK